MLLRKPNCECCGVALPADSDEAVICSFECTYCRSCAADRLHHTCPNCGGALSARPPRATALLEMYPASTDRGAIVGPCAEPEPATS